MSARPVVLRQAAASDVDAALDRYTGEGGERLALEFVDTLEAAFRYIAENPLAGSPRYAVELDLPALRSWSLKRFPYVIFYVNHDDMIDVWRVLHGHQDIPAWLLPDD